MSKVRYKGKWGWLLLAGYVGIWDGLATQGITQTLSSSFCTALKRPKQKWWVIACWAYITLHLFSGIPSRYDPFRVLAVRLGAEQEYDTSSVLDMLD